MSTPEKITATYRIVTPMFIGDANQDAKGITAASVKGALRFWWRALNWGRIYAGYSKEVDALKVLHEEEAALFGSPAYDNQGIGQSKVWLRVKQPANLQSLIDWPVAPTNRNQSRTASNYMGMGLWETNNTKQRSALQENQSFTLEIVYRHLLPAQKESLLQALKILGLVGGLGGRSRRAFGSISIERLGNDDYQYSSEDEYVNLLKKTLRDIKLSTKYPPYTAFSEKGMLATTTFSATKTAREYHAELASFYKEQRTDIAPATNRKVFGLPIQTVSKKRRTSPLFFHIHPLKDKFIGLALFMPSAPFHHDKYLLPETSLAAKYKLIEQLFTHMKPI